MFVRRSDVSLRDSIHLESCVTGANAMSSSEDGSAAPSSFERTKRSIEGSAVTRPGITGFQSVAGVSVASIATLRGPVRRSRYGAIDSRHESAACCRSAGVNSTCTSFSASANVSGETAGPDPLPVPKVGGAPAGGDCAVCELAGGCVSLRQAVAATRKVSGALIRNCRLVFISSFFRWGLKSALDQERFNFGVATAEGPVHRGHVHRASAREHHVAEALAVLSRHAAVL